MNSTICEPPSATGSTQTTKSKSFTKILSKISALFSFAALAAIAFMVGSTFANWRGFNAIVYAPFWTYPNVESSLIVGLAFITIVTILDAPAAWLWFLFFDGTYELISAPFYVNPYAFLFFVCAAAALHMGGRLPSYRILLLLVAWVAISSTYFVLRSQISEPLLQLLWIAAIIMPTPVALYKKLPLKAKLLVSFKIVSHFRAYESELVQHVPRGSIALDVGSNRGLWAKFLSKRFEKVICFEPNIYAIRDSLHHTKKCKNVKVFNAALWHEHAEPTLELCEDSAHSFIDETGSAHPTRIIGSRRILAFPLDSFVINGHVDFIKIDAEGSEFNILSGATKTLESNGFPTLMIEIHSRQLGLKCSNLLSNMGYKLIHVANQYEPLSLNHFYLLALK